MGLYGLSPVKILHKSGSFSQELPSLSVFLISALIAIQMNTGEFFWNNTFLSFTVCVLRNRNFPASCRSSAASQVAPVTYTDTIHVLNQICSPLMSSSFTHDKIVLGLDMERKKIDSSAIKVVQKHLFS